MSKEVDFYFDFASPNAYLSHKSYNQLKKKQEPKLTIFLFY